MHNNRRRNNKNNRNITRTTTTTTASKPFVNQYSTTGGPRVVTTTTTVRRGRARGNRGRRRRNRGRINLDRAHTVEFHVNSILATPTYQGDDQVFLVSLNPRLFEGMTRSVSALYDSYRWENLQIHYNPIASKFKNGTVYMGIFLDDNFKTDPGSILSAIGGTQVAVSSKKTMYVPINTVNYQRWMPLDISSKHPILVVLAKGLEDVGKAYCDLTVVGNLKFNSPNNQPKKTEAMVTTLSDAAQLSKSKEQGRLFVIKPPSEAAIAKMTPTGAEPTKSLWQLLKAGVSAIFRTIINSNVKIIVQGYEQVIDPANDIDDSIVYYLCESVGEDVGDSSDPDAFEEIAVISGTNAKPICVTCNEYVLCLYAGTPMAVRTGSDTAVLSKSNVAMIKFYEQHDAAYYVLDAQSVENYIKLNNIGEGCPIPGVPYTNDGNTVADYYNASYYFDTSYLIAANANQIVRGQVCAPISKYTSWSVDLKQHVYYTDGPSNVTIWTNQTELEQVGYYFNFPDEFLHGIHCMDIGLDFGPIASTFDLDVVTTSIQPCVAGAKVNVGLYGGAYYYYLFVMKSIGADQGTQVRIALPIPTAVNGQYTVPASGYQFRLPVGATESAADPLQYIRIIGATLRGITTGQATGSEIVSLSYAIDEKIGAAWWSANFANLETAVAAGFLHELKYSSLSDLDRKVEARIVEASLPDDDEAPVVATPASVYHSVIS